MADDRLNIYLNPDLNSEVARVVALGDTPLELAEKIAEIARQNAPVGDTGEYRDGIKAQRTKSGARVFANDYKSAWIEFGVPSQGQPAHFILRRAVEAAGLDFRKKKGATDA